MSFVGIRITDLASSDGFRGSAHVAQLVERVLGKDEVTSSILVIGSSTFQSADSPR